jgi:2-polyprenyl-3-methyl-5-hydroxy-6-metoxy-1,4-benzoquinol methylase
MNRKERRAAIKQRPLAASQHAAGNSVGQLFADALRYQRENKLDDAARIYKRLLLLNPAHAEACNNLGLVLLAQGKRNEASALFAKALTLMPQLLDQYSGVNATLVVVLPALVEAMQKAGAAWPRRLPLDQLFGDAGLAAIWDDPMLLCLLQSVPPRSIDFERLMTSLRLALLDAASTGEPVAPSALAFCCALAKQCFINEYAFATTPYEDAKVEQLNSTIGEAIKSGAAIAPISIAASAMYKPLHALIGAQALLDSTWPSVLDDLLTQQLREPQQELLLRPSIPRLTPIEDDVSQRVRRQYEENPYPRWVRIAGCVESKSLDQCLRETFPTAKFTPLGKTELLDILVAGCGTGWHPTSIAQGYLGAQVLAVDLSLTSLCYAKRKTPASLSERITYMQGDILKLGGSERRFDVVDASGVLHHMADPIEGLRILLTLLRPGGFMHLGLYSEAARRDVVAARAYIAERGYTPSPADIRRCRQDLLETPLRALARTTDFFTISECRDLLFHVQESRMTIPAIKNIIAKFSLQFIGFEFDKASRQRYRALFDDAGWSLTDLNKWEALETQYPDTFLNMYQFWVQKSCNED